MTNKPALEGGPPVRTTFLPYSRPVLTEEDVAAALAVLRSGWLTTGPTIGRLEEAFAAEAGSGHVVAVASCTAALHIAYATIPLAPGDEVVVPVITFAATAATVVAAGGRPVLADVGDDLNIDIEDAARRVTPRTRALAAVHLAGLPCALQPLADLCAERDLALVQDCAHAVGTRYRGRPPGAWGRAVCYSFHAVKQLAAGEGGVLATNDATVAERARLFRSHFQTTSAASRHGAEAGYRYDIVGAGFNYRLGEVNAALAFSQLGRAEADGVRRRAIADRYDAAFGGRDDLEIIPTPRDAQHGRHLYIVKLRLETLTVDRDVVFRALRAENIGANVHYIPLHYFYYYQKTFGYRPGDFPHAEALFGRAVTLPLFAAMADRDVDDCIAAVDKILSHYRR